MAGGVRPVVGVVLAAGAGRRFGSPKILAHQGDWLRRSVAALSVGGCDEVLVAMGATMVDAPSGATVVRVENWARGLSETVRAAVSAARTRNCVGMVLHVVDTPDVGPPVVARVLAAAGRREDAVIRPVFNGQPGHPVYLGAAYLDGVLRSLSGDVGAGRYLRAHPEIVTDVECGDLASGVDHDEPEGDADTPAVRIATADDAEVVGGLLHDFNVEFDTPTPSAAEFAARFAVLLQRDDVVVLVADHGQIASIGFAFLTLRPTPYGDGPIAQLEELYVRPAYRGRGIGSTLIDAALTHVTAVHAVEMQINVDEIDADARRFYERHGFVNLQPGTDYRMLCYLREL